MVNFEENYHFSRFQRGSNIFHGEGGGGFQLLPGGPIAYSPIETHITCDFPGGPDPLTPLVPHLLSPGFPAFLVFLLFPSILNVLLVFPSFVKNLLVFLVFHKFGTFLDKCFEILFQNKIFRVLN